jgi:hypothetical protein
MNVDVRDVHQVLEYRLATTIVRLLPIGLLLIFLSLVIFALVDPAREPIRTFIGIGICMVMGIGVIGIALWTRSDPGKPLFTLSPAGIHFRIAWVKEFLIPWHEIKGVDTIDVETGYWSMLWSTHTLRYNDMTFHGVTAVLVPKQFYESRIYVDSFFLRGPGWDANFIPKGSLVQVALHREIVSCPAQELRVAVEARWNAFRDQPAIEPARSSVPRVTAAGKVAPPAKPAAKPGVARGESPKSMPLWETVIVVALLIGIAGASANIAGMWNLPGQAEDRVKRAKATEERKYWAERSRQIKEEWKQREADEEKRRREFDDTMRRTFGVR